MRFGIHPKARQFFVLTGLSVGLVGILTHCMCMILKYLFH